MVIVECILFKDFIKVWFGVVAVEWWNLWWMDHFLWFWWWWLLGWVSSNGHCGVGDGDCNVCGFGWESGVECW